MSGCCPSEEKKSQAGDACHLPKNRPDYLLWITLSLTAIGYTLMLLKRYAGLSLEEHLHKYSHASFELMNTMWWGIALGIFFVGILSKVPREYVISVIGKPGKKRSILKATLAGLLLDLCSHGILMVGMKLYERGASAGQVMAFLIASPWNSLSMTLILFALIGLKWTLVFIVMSAVVAIISGIIFDFLVKREVLPSNPYHMELPEGFSFFKNAKEDFRKTQFSLSFFKEMLVDGVKDSKMIVRWIFLGVVLSALVKTFVSADTFQQFFGPSLMGLGLTLFATTVIEVCSEGSAPLAADLMTRAAAPGNSFTFLMAGVATDYTEILSIKSRTKSWKMALFLPLVTVPQVLILGYIMNQMGQ